MPTLPLDPETRALAFAQRYDYDVQYMLDMLHAHPEAYARFEAFLPLAFHNRRKTLVNSVAEAADRPLSEVVSRLESVSFQQKIRAEAIDAVQLCALAHSWAVSAPGERRRP